MKKSGPTFKAHNMYDKQKAETNEEHLALKEKGYGHTPLKRCYKTGGPGNRGYMPNPDGRPAKQSGSCVPRK